MTDPTYLEALQQLRIELDLACQKAVESIDALWKEGTVLDSEFFTLVELQDEVERLESQKAEVWALYTRAQGRTQGQRHTDQIQEGPPQ